MSDDAVPTTPGSAPPDLGADPGAEPGPGPAGGPSHDPGSDPGVTALGYEAAIAELEAIVTDLQRDEVGVDELAARVARGAALVEVCRDRLRRAELAVEEVVAALRPEEASGAPPESDRQG